MYLNRKKMAGTEVVFVERPYPDPNPVEYVHVSGSGKDVVNCCDVWFKTNGGLPNMTLNVYAVNGILRQKVGTTALVAKFGQPISVRGICCESFEVDIINLAGAPYPGPLHIRLESYFDEGADKTDLAGNATALALAVDINGQEFPLSMDQAGSSNLKVAVKTLNLNGGNSAGSVATNITTATMPGFLNTIPYGIYLAAPPVLTDGRGSLLMLDVANNLRIAEQFQPVYEDNTNGVAATHDLPQGGATYNATSSQIIAKANTGVMKAAAGNLYRAYFTNDNAAAQPYALVNKATNPATADTPELYFYVPAKTTILMEWRFGKRFNTGIAWAQVTTLGAATITLAASSDSLVSAEVK